MVLICLATAGLGQIINLGDGNDIDVALGAGNVVTGGLGDDVIYVAGSLNTVFAGEGNDVLFAFGGGSVLNGGAGNDVYLSLGMASRILQSKGLLNNCTAAIHTAIDVLNGATQSISSEVTPDKISDYSIQDSSIVIQDVSGGGSNVFYSGCEKTMVQAGSGDDSFHFYLGDADMGLTSGSGRDHLYINADLNEYAVFGMQTSIDISDLFYEAGSKTLSICRNNLNYGRLNLEDFDSNDTISLLMSNGKSVDVLLDSLQAPSTAQNTTPCWSPSAPAPMDASSVTSLTDLYDQLQSQLMINAAIL
jgi:Ca2+-binding RTX toxin-like protein